MRNTAFRLLSAAAFVLVWGCNDSTSSVGYDGASGFGRDAKITLPDLGPVGGHVGDTGTSGTGGQGAAAVDGAALVSEAGTPASGGAPGSDGAGATVPDAPMPGSDGSPSPAGNDAGGTPVGAGDAALSCGHQGAACQTSGDCCGLACVGGLCGASACLSDGTACASGAECCSTLCGAGGTCVALNPTCKTAGNACTSNAECCNKTCNANHQCASPADVSFCAQTGDLCRGDGECCTGVCVMAAGAAAGTCATITTSCKIDGTLCNGCGDCCSHFCGPYGPNGPKICQPASGCHVQGDLCRKDSDCCGGDTRAALPGSGLIKCVPDPTYGSRIGTCGNPSASNCPSGSPNCRNACNPEGNVCHYKDTLVCAGSLTNLRNDCCECISGKECCQPDATGIPRCNALAACVPVGGSCSFSNECCNHLPCVPDPASGRLVCGAACVQAGGACTTNADCCTGMLCHTSAGGVAGVCTVPVAPPVQAPDAGTLPGPDAPAQPGDDAAVAPGDDAAVAPGDDAAVAPPTPDAPILCSYYGQSCSTAIPCCGSILCRAAYTGAECTDTDTDCLCYNLQ